MMVRGSRAGRRHTASTDPVASIVCAPVSRQGADAHAEAERAARAFRDRAGGFALLGLDPGARWMGVAVADPSWRVATALSRLPRAGAARDAETLAALAAERGARGVVVGYPLTMAGRRGSRADASASLAQALEAQGLAVWLQDERLSTQAVVRDGAAASPRARDMAAATWILQGVLERMRLLR